MTEAATTVANRPPQAIEYETIYILAPTTPPEEAAKVAERIVEVLGRMSAKLVAVDNWGKRRLAYAIKKHTRGIFVYVRYVALNNVVAELERNLRMLDQVIRHQTVRIRGGLDLAAVQVDPEEVKFTHVEMSTEPEEEEGLDRRLGFASLPDLSAPPADFEVEGAEAAAEDDAAPAEAAGEDEEATTTEPAAASDEDE